MNSVHQDILALQLVGQIDSVVRNADASLSNRRLVIQRWIASKLGAIDVQDGLAHPACLAKAGKWYGYGFTMRTNPVVVVHPLPRKHSGHLLFYRYVCPFSGATHELELRIHVSTGLRMDPQKAIFREVEKLNSNFLCTYNPTVTQLLVEKPFARTHYW